MRVRILLADDFTIVRQGLRALLEKDPGFEIVAEAGSDQEVLRLAEECKPDIVVMDVPPSNTTGPKLTQQIKALSPGTKVIGLASFVDGHIASSLLQNGALACVSKTDGSEELSRAIYETTAGRTYLSPQMAAAVCAGGDGADGDGLTSRQLEILQMYVSGHSTKEIALNLGRSIKTVEMHRQNIMVRLKLHNLADLTKYAIRKGLVSLGS
jgi:DNA-binding NarL/FixJ family response regulator